MICMHALPDRKVGSPAGSPHSHLLNTTTPAVSLITSECNACACISTGCRTIQALLSHREGDPTKSGEIRAKTSRYPPPSHVGAPYAGPRTAAQLNPTNPNPDSIESRLVSLDPPRRRSGRPGSSEIGRDLAGSGKIWADWVGRADPAATQSTPTSKGRQIRPRFD